MKKKNFLVTGAAGFIGAAVAIKLLDDGNFVVTIDNLSTGFMENIPKGTVFIEGDCSNQESIDQLKPFRFDTILHIAGQSSGEISFGNPAYDLKTNTLSTLLLLKYAHEHGCRKFIYASTMSVYGNQLDEPVTEEALLSPLSFYAVGKIASENYMKIYSEFGMTNIALRFFNVYGPGQDMKNLKQGMVRIFLAQAINSKKIIVRGNPERYRDFVYIDDAVDVIYKLNNISRIKGYLCLNVSTGIRTEVRELIQIIKSNFNFEIPCEYAESTPGDQFGIYGNNNRLKKIVSISNFVNLNDGIHNMIKKLNL